jgi:hypothetical protein
MDATSASSKVGTTTTSKRNRRRVGARCAPGDAALPLLRPACRRRPEPRSMGSAAAPGTPARFRSARANRHRFCPRTLVAIGQRGQRAMKAASDDCGMRQLAAIDVATELGEGAAAWIRPTGFNRPQGFGQGADLGQALFPSPGSSCAGLASCERTSTSPIQLSDRTSQTLRWRLNEVESGPAVPVLGS